MYIVNRIEDIPNKKEYIRLNGTYVEENSTFIALKIDELKVWYPKKCLVKVTEPSKDVYYVETDLLYKRKFNNV